MKPVPLPAAIEAKLRQLSLKYGRRLPFLDPDDLLSEMKVFLLMRCRGKGLGGKTESYIVQSCYFFLRNYLRKACDGEKLLSLDDPLNCPPEDGERTRLEEVLPDRGPDTERGAEGNVLYETIMHGGFSWQEKRIVELLCSGFTVREVGRQLGISHAS
jgi:hypothetical protein